MEIDYSIEVPAEVDGPLFKSVVAYAELHKCSREDAMTALGVSERALTREDSLLNAPRRAALRAKFGYDAGKVATPSRKKGVTRTRQGRHSYFCSTCRCAVLPEEAPESLADLIAARMASKRRP